MNLIHLILLTKFDLSISNSLNQIHIEKISFKRHELHTLTRDYSIIYCFDETFRKFINFINCPLTEKVWENPVYGTFNLYLLYAFFSACVLFIQIRQYLEDEKPEETREKLAAIANFIDAMGHFE